jgi:ABC-type sugar transport system permease subunit
MIVTGNPPASSSDLAGAAARSDRREVILAFLLVLPALATVALLFLYPLSYSLVSALQANGSWTLANFAKAWELYSRDIGFTVLIIAGSTLLIGLVSIAIAGYLTLGENPRAVAILRWLYRWPLFIPFIVAGQLMRSFLAKNGLMNNIATSLDLYSPMAAPSFLDWRGIVITFVWKQAPFVALLLAGAMASLDRSTIEAARNLGAGRLRILVEIVLPQVRQSLVVALVLSVVTMMSVLSVPLMINAQSPTMITVDMAFRINSYGDYGTANALGFISYLMTGAVAWIYLRHGVRGGGKPGAHAGSCAGWPSGCSPS